VDDYAYSLWVWVTSAQSAVGDVVAHAWLDPRVWVSHSKVEESLPRILKRTKPQFNSQQRRQGEEMNRIRSIGAAIGLTALLIHCHRSRGLAAKSAEYVPDGR